MTLDQMSAPAHTFIRETRRGRAAMRNDRLSFFNTQHSMKSPFSESPSQAAGARTVLAADEIKQAFRDYLIFSMGCLEYRPASSIRERT